MNPLRRSATAALVALVLARVDVPNAHATPIDWVTVGDPGNAADTTTYGAVSYEYRIGKYEVTIQQYTGFLNAVAASDPNGLYSTDMASDQNSAGISRSGSSGAFTYTVMGPFGTKPSGADSAGNRPITYTSWFDAARFANWLSNGQPTGTQDASTTEDGAYALSGTTTAPARNAVNPNTGVAPTHWIPTENEWYKAAYYKGGGTNAGYWAYAMQSNASPGNTIGSGTNQANFASTNGGPYAVTKPASFSASQNYLTNVGAFSANPSAYDTYDQSGNVREWNDFTAVSGTSRGLRGGHWVVAPVGWTKAGRSVDVPTIQNDYTGFRLAGPAIVPEPSTYAMAVAGLACGGFSMWRRRKRV